jgi:hypothetical protein
MRNLMDQLFRRYGTDAVILRGDDRQEVKAFFHSVNSRSWQNMERMFFPLGEIHRGQYICVLPISAQAGAGDTLRINGCFFMLRRVEEMFVKGQSVYRWCLCVEKGRDDNWGSNGS